MKCCSCDVILSDFEATRRGALSGEFLDLCNKCIKGLNIATIDRPDLHDSGYEDEEEDYSVYGYFDNQLEDEE